MDQREQIIPGGNVFGNLVNETANLERNGLYHTITDGQTLRNSYAEQESAVLNQGKLEEKQAEYDKRKEYLLGTDSKQGLVDEIKNVLESIEKRREILGYDNSLIAIDREYSNLSRRLADLQRERESIVAELQRLESDINFIKRANNQHDENRVEFFRNEIEELRLVQRDKEAFRRELERLQLERYNGEISARVINGIADAEKEIRRLEKTERDLKRFLLRNGINIRSALATIHTNFERRESLETPTTTLGGSDDVAAQTETDDELDKKEETPATTLGGSDDIATQTETGDELDKKEETPTTTLGGSDDVATQTETGDELDKKEETPTTTLGGSDDVATQTETGDELDKKTDNVTYTGNEYEIPLLIGKERIPKGTAIYHNVPNESLSVPVEGKVFTTDDVQTLLSSLYDDVIETMGNLSTIKVEQLENKNQDARLLSVRGKEMDSFKRAGGAFLGKEENPEHIDLPNGEYIKLEEFIEAVTRYFEIKENRKRKFEVRSDEWRGKRRKIDRRKIKELKKLAREANRLMLEKNERIENQDGRVVYANVPNDALGYDKAIGGLMLGSPEGNEKKGLPRQILPDDEDAYILKEDAIRALEKIFKVYRRALPPILPIPIAPLVEQAMVRTTVEETEIQEKEVKEFSQDMVIGDVLKIKEGTEFYHDSWLSTPKGFIGNRYTQAINTVNKFTLINNDTNQYWTVETPGTSLKTYIETAKQNGLIGDNYTVMYHVCEGNVYTKVGTSNDVGWFVKDDSKYEYEQKTSIGTKTETITITTTATYEGEVEDIDNSYSNLILEANNNAVILKSPTGEPFKIYDGIELVDSEGKKYKCDVEITERKFKLKAIIPIIVPVNLLEEDEEKEKGEENNGIRRG